MAQPYKKANKYTYEDYVSWPDEENWELIEGEAYPVYGLTALAAPSLRHQRLTFKVASALDSYLQGKSCEMYMDADVLLEDREDFCTIVRPDVLVVCDPSKIREKNVVGAPDIVVEVLSPSTTPKDWNTKLRLYEREGVREYWIVNPIERVLYKHILKDGLYEAETFTQGEMSTDVLEGFALDIDTLFAE